MVVLRNRTKPPRGGGRKCIFGERFNEAACAKVLAVLRDNPELRLVDLCYRLGVSHNILRQFLRLNGVPPVKNGSWKVYLDGKKQATPEALAARKRLVIRLLAPEIPADWQPPYRPVASLYTDDKKRLYKQAGERAAA